MSKKRKQGEGTLRKRADGRWEARVVIGYDDKGLPITKNVTAKEKDKCFEKLEQLKEKCGVQLTGKVKADMEFGDGLTSGISSMPSKSSDRPRNRGMKIIFTSM